MNKELVSNKSTQERVNEICNQLYSTNQKMSVRIVLAEMPDVSSTSTIHNYYKQWKDNVDANQQSLYDRLGFSSKFIQSFMEEISRFSVETEVRYKSIAESADEQSTHAIEDLKHSEDKLFEHKDIIKEQEHALKELKVDLAKEKNANEVIVKELRQQLTGSFDDNKKLTSINEELRITLTKEELKSENNIERCNELKQLNTQLTSENKKLNKSISSLTTDVAAKNSTIVGNKDLIKNLQSQQDKLSSQAESMTKQIIKLQTELDLLKTKYQK